jgi:hypothetical protein
MLENCYEGAQFYNLPYDTTREILIAALFHDFAHTGGHATDNENIRRAYHHGLKMYFRSGVSELVWQCIRCTQYPFVYEPLTIEQRIIRDADLMQFRYSNWKDVLLVKLKLEIEVAQAREISEDEMIEGQRKFWSGVKFYTDWGKGVYQREASEMVLYLLRLGV